MPPMTTLGRNSDTTVVKADWFHRRDKKKGKYTRYMYIFTNGFLFISKHGLIDSETAVLLIFWRKKIKIPQSGINFPSYAIKMWRMRLQKSSIEFNLTSASVPSLIFWDCFLTCLTNKEKGRSPRLRYNLIFFQKYSLPWFLKDVFLLLQ